MKRAPFNRWSRRRQARSLLIALADRHEWGRPERVGASVLPARTEGLCPDCGALIGLGQSIIKALHGPPDQRAEVWVHGWCPDIWTLVTGVLEDRDGVIITQVNLEGRRVAGCGHDVEGRPVYLVRRPVPLSRDDHSYWACEECVTR